MATKWTGTPWMSAEQYRHGLTGFGVNLLVRDVTASVDSAACHDGQDGNVYRVLLTWRLAACGTA